jgi:hypothetical protein
MCLIVPHIGVFGTGLNRVHHGVVAVHHLIIIREADVVELDALFH